MDEKNMAEIKIIAAKMQKIYDMAYRAYLPIVTELCERIASQNEIEHTLDSLLDFACEEKCLRLFKKLCRRYYPLDFIEKFGTRLMSKAMENELESIGE